MAHLSPRDVELIDKVVDSTIRSLTTNLLPKAFEEHIKSCPIGVVLLKGKWMFIGALLLGALAVKGGFPLLEELWKLIARAL